MLPYTSDEMYLILVFQQDNDAKYNTKVAEKWFLTKGNNVLELPAEAGDVNTIENRSCYVKKAVEHYQP